MNDDIEQDVIEEWAVDRPDAERPYSEYDPDEVIQPRRISRTTRLVGLMAALAMLAIPLWNVIDARTPQFAHNGLEVCAFDYCEVQQQVDAAGFGVIMAGASQIPVSDRDTQALVDSFSVVLDGPDVTIEVVDGIDGGVAGQYIRSERHIQVERPARVWVVAHEVAHSVSNGHDDDFLEALLELATYLDGDR